MRRVVEIAIKTVKELIEELEALDPSMLVKGAFQPNWPMRASVVGVKEAFDDELGKTVAFVKLGSNEGYAPEETYKSW